MLPIAQKLDQLSSLYSQIEALQAEKQKLIEEVIPPELRARLSDIEDEFAQREEAANESITALEARIKADTLSFGETVKASGFIAVWNKGRVSWDNKGLTGYAQSHAEILQFRKEGDPSATIRRVQAKDATAQ